MKNYFLGLSALPVFLIALIFIPVGFIGYLIYFGLFVGWKLGEILVDQIGESKYE